MIVEFKKKWQFSSNEVVLKNKKNKNKQLLPSRDVKIYDCQHK